MIKNRARAQSYLLTNCHDKRHCPEDLACAGCCPCAKELRKRTGILLDKITGMKQEKQELERLLRKFTKQIEQYQKKVKSMKGAEEAKEELREEIRKELDEQRRLDDLIAQEKMDSLKERKQELQRENGLLKPELQKMKDQCAILNAAQKRAVKKHKELESKFQQGSRSIQEQGQRLKQQQTVLVSLKQALLQKTNLITSLSTAIAKGQENYTLEKSKAANLQFKSFKSQQEIKSSNILIELLKQKDQQKTIGIETLTIEKNDLRQLVSELDSTIFSYGKLQTQLKDRLWVSEQYALQKQIEAKQVQMDYYDLRRHV